MVVKVLNENTVYKRGYLAEHGMSLLIEYEGRKILFDTGQSDVFMRNASRMGENLMDLDAIILSHGHYDHCGGLEYLAEMYHKGEGSLMAAADKTECIRANVSRFPHVYVRENAFENKKARNEGTDTYREIGIPWRLGRTMEQLRERFVYTGEYTQLFENVYLISGIPYVTEFERVNAALKIDRNGELIEDSMIDEQILVIRSDKGLHVFAGCSHPGIINVLRLVQAKFPGEHIYSLYAGMHLIGVASKKLEIVIEEIDKLNIDLIIPVHCTGQSAAAAIKAEFGDKCRQAVVSDVIEL